MPTSSIFHNFVIEGKEAVEQFANAVEESFNREPHKVEMKAEYLTDPEEIAAFMRMREEKRKNK